MTFKAHPLAESMARLGQINPSFNMPIKNPAVDGWISADDLFLTDDVRLRELVTTYGAWHWGSTNRHVVGSAFIIAYLTRLVWPVIGQYVLEGRVPNVSLPNLAFHRTAGPSGSQNRRYCNGPSLLRIAARRPLQEPRRCRRGRG